MIYKNIVKVLTKSSHNFRNRQLSTMINYKFAINENKERRFQQIRNHTTMSQYPNLNPIVKEHIKNEVKLKQNKQTGLRFLIQQGGFPGCADIGICLKLGTQDETNANAGSLQSLKSFVHMKPSFEEIVQNYQFLNQTGATFDFNYDAMTTYAKCSFLQEDQDLMLNLLLDLVIQQKNLFEDNQQTQIDNSNINQLVRRTAFGNQGLGMPGRGVGNILSNQEFLKFQQKITPKNMIISMSNISNPQKFVTKIIQRIKSKYPQFLKRQPQPTPKSKYVGGLGVYQTNNQNYEFAIAFPSVNTKSEQMELFNILRVLLGSASSFSSGGPGKGMHSRCTRNLLNSVQSVEKASYINQHFDDYGLFGLTVGGPSEQYEQLIACCINQISILRQLISEEELDRAKHILISGIYQNIERQPDRLEELTKHIFYYDKVKLYEFEHNIRKVTAKQIQTILKKIFENKPTLIHSVNDSKIKSKLPKEENLLKGLRTAFSQADKK